MLEKSRSVTVEIEHRYVHTRKVQLPDRCPGRDGHPCDADLTEEDALRAWQYHEQVWPAALGEGGEGDYDQGGHHINTANGSESGEDWTATTALYCCSCGTPLAEGGMHDELSEVEVRAIAALRAGIITPAELDEAIRVAVGAAKANE